MIKKVRHTFIASQMNTVCKHKKIIMTVESLSPLFFSPNCTEACSVSGTEWKKITIFVTWWGC